jgi:hypothetical protein
MDKTPRLDPKSSGESSPAEKHLTQSRRAAEKTIQGLCGSAALREMIVC